MPTATSRAGAPPARRSCCPSPAACTLEGAPPQEDALIRHVGLRLLSYSLSYQSVSAKILGRSAPKSPDNTMKTRLWPDSAAIHGPPADAPRAPLRRSPARHGPAAGVRCG